MTEIGHTHEAPALLSPGRNWAKRQIRAVLARVAIEDGVVLSAIRYRVEMDQEEGPILVGRANVIGVATATSLSSQLDKKDLGILRRVTRRAYLNAGGGLLTDTQCDVVIDRIAPVSVEALIREAHDETKH